MPAIGSSWSYLTGPLLGDWKRRGGRLPLEGVFGRLADVEALCDPVSAREWDACDGEAGGCIRERGRWVRYMLGCLKSWEM